MAINSLKQESCDDCVSREEAIKAIDNVLSEYSIYFLFRDRCTEALMLLPSVQPNREKHEAGRNETTVGMTKEKIDILKRLRGKMDDDMLDTFYETKDEEREALSEAIKILDQGFDVDKHDAEVIKETVASVWGKPPCDDAISRQAVMDALCDRCDLFHRNGEQTCLTKCEEYRFLATLPLVYPQNTEVLDKIRAEIEEQIERDFAFAKTEEVKMPVHYGTANGLQVAVRITDKYRGERNE